MSWINMKCRCGYEADLGEFSRTPIAGELPPGHFQCPACRVAWKRQESGHRLFHLGTEVMIIPGKTEIIPVEGSL